MGEGIPPLESGPKWTDEAESGFGEQCGESGLHVGNQVRAGRDQDPGPRVGPGGLGPYLARLSRLAQARQGQGPGPWGAEQGPLEPTSATPGPVI